MEYIHFVTQNKQRLSHMLFNTQGQTINILDVPILFPTTTCSPFLQTQICLEEIREMFEPLGVASYCTELI